MKKRIFGAILCLVMVLTLLPVTAFAESYPTAIKVRNSNGNEIIINGGQCLETNTATTAKTYSGGTAYVARYDGSTGTLYLRGFHGKIKDDTTTRATSVISSNSGDYTVNVETDSTLTVTMDKAIDSRTERDVIYCGGKLSIEGSGKLTVNISNDHAAYGIYSKTGLSISAAMELNGTKMKGRDFYGLYTDAGAMTLSGGAKTINISATDEYPRAVYNFAKNSSVNGNGKITIGCPLDITLNGTKGGGITTNPHRENVNGSITLDGADVRISGTSRGIYDGSMAHPTSSGIVIKNSSLNIISTVNDSEALTSDNNGVNISNSTVTAMSDHPAIFANRGVVDIKNSKVDLTANIVGGATKVIYTKSEDAINTVDLSGSGIVILTYRGELVFPPFGNKLQITPNTECVKGIYDSRGENYHGIFEDGKTTLILAHKPSGTPEGYEKFLNQPASKTLQNGQTYDVKWTTNFTPDYVAVERYYAAAGMWSSIQTGTATGTTLPCLEENSSARLRAVAYKDGVVYYSSEFVVTWTETVPTVSLNNIAVINLDAPGVGAHPDMKMTVVGANQDHIQGTHKWVRYGSDGRGTDMTAEDVFEPSVSYGCYITIESLGTGTFPYATLHDDYGDPYYPYSGIVTINGIEVAANTQDNGKTLSFVWTMEALQGDITGNGVVDGTDLTALLRHVAKIELLTGASLDRANVDGIGVIDAADVTWLAKKLGS